MEATTEILKPDVSFVQKIMANGGKTLKKCFQCGNCSVVCNISPDNVPFPRKEMIWAQWGLKDKLLGDADIWLCHQCNDCSAHCPRGANPGDVMAAVRNVSFQHFAPFGLGKLLSSPKYLPLLLGLPIILIAIAVMVASKDNFMSMTPIVFSNMMPVPAIDAVFLPAVIFAAIGAFIGIKNILRAFGAAAPGVEKPTGSPVSTAIKVVKGILKHEKMYKCEANAPRTSFHQMLFYGFFILVATTTLVAIMYWINKLGIAEVSTTPLALYHPVKLLGNIGALLAFIGLAKIYYRRKLLNDPKNVGNNSYYDNFFTTVLFWTVVTGILAEIFRLIGIAALAFGVYYIHLVLVFALLAYAPFSKFAHMFYRFVALVFSIMARRDGGGPATTENT